MSSQLRGTLAPHHPIGLNEDIPRLKWLREKVHSAGLSLNIGAKDVELCSVRADVDPQSAVDVLCDTRRLPFRSEVFNEVVFSEVLEHLPRNSEIGALQEIHRVIRTGGRLYLTTPSNVAIFSLLDPAWYVGHRHYSKQTIETMLEAAGFSRI